MASRVLVCLGVGAMIGLVVGCGKSEGSAHAIPRDELSQRVASLLCESVAGCCRTGGFPFDLAACKTGTAAELQEDWDDDDPSRVSYDGQAAGDCLAAVGPMLACGEVEGVTPPACERIWRGKVALGQECGSDRECERAEGQRVVCDYDSSGLPPTRCTELPVSRHGKQGEACSGTCSEGSSCIGVVAPDPGPGVGGGAGLPLPEPVICYRDDGLYCDSSSVCAPLVQSGFPCDDYAACQGDAFCDLSMQLCSAPRGNGEACSHHDECESGACFEPDGVGPNGTCAAAGVTAEQCADPL